MARRSFCVVDARKCCQECKNTLTNGSTNRQFSKDGPFSRRGLLAGKSAFFDRPRVARCTRYNSKVDSRLISSDRGCLDYSTQKCCSRANCLLKKRSKNPDTGRTDTGLTDAGFQASPTQNALRAITERVSNVHK